MRFQQEVKVLILIQSQLLFLLQHTWENSTMAYTTAQPTRDYTTSANTMDGSHTGSISYGVYNMNVGKALLEI